MRTPKQIADSIVTEIVRDARVSLSTKTAEFIRSAVEVAIEDGFAVGFEHAVAGGEEAAKIIPSLVGKMPLVLYFDNEADRKDMVDGLALAAGLTAARIPKRRQ